MRSLAPLLLYLAALAVPAHAQEIPGRVGRLAWLQGDVAVYQDPDRGWDDAFLNFPVTSRNSIWTDDGARAEVQVGAIAMRMEQASQLDVSRIDDDVLDATLERGVLEVRVHHRDPGEVIRLSTPQAIFAIASEGRYRLDSDPDDGQSRLSVFSGNASLETAEGRVRIGSGESIVVWGEDYPSYAMEDAYLTSFDRWAIARDERSGAWRPPEYVSYQMTGYEDLDAYGEWLRDRTYGVVWFPSRVPEDWAPYRYGRWTYLEPWGWTWVDAEPWGYAPFHYGRWAFIDGRWGWCPGPRVARPVWAPALVGFVGGSDWSVRAVSAGPIVRWYPLAPSQSYRPWYRASRRYVDQVNAAVVEVPQRIAREHREGNRERATTAVRREALIERRPVAQARIAVAPQAARAAPAITLPATVLPSRSEVREAHRHEAARNPAMRGGPARAPAIAGEPAGSSPMRTGPAPGPNAIARPKFAKPRVAPKAAGRGEAPPPPAHTGSTGSPLSRGTAADEEHQRAAREGERRDAQAREQAAQEAQQRASQEARRAAQEAQQRASEAQQRAQQQAEQARAQREAQQRAAEAQQRAAREAQQRAAQEAQQRAAHEAQQRAAQQAQQRAAEAQQRAAEAQQREKESQGRPQHGGPQAHGGAPGEEGAAGREKEKARGDHGEAEPKG